MRRRDSGLPRVSWQEAELQRLLREREEMSRCCPDMVWRHDARAGGWEGLAPEWPMPRARPAGLENLLSGRRLRLRVDYSPAFPMVEPRLWPLEPEPPRERRLRHPWHLNADGSLCLLEQAWDWDPSATAADLVVKASGWFIEYRLMEAGRITEMSERGIYVDASLDPVIETFA